LSIGRLPEKDASGNPARSSCARSAASVLNIPKGSE
jgi:hypothetical protein